MHGKCTLMFVDGTGMAMADFIYFRIVTSAILSFYVHVLKLFCRLIAIHS